MNEPKMMNAMVLEQTGHSLKLAKRPVPMPRTNQVLLKVHACGVCRTDLHILDGDLADPKLPLVPGHQIIGTVVNAAEGVDRFAIGDKVGVPWLGETDGTCRFCQRGQENLCDSPQFTGYTIDGGFAEYAVANQQYCLAVQSSYDDAHAAPLLCAGLIGYRSYRLAGDNIQHLGLYGFGAAAHIIAQVALHEKKCVYAFTRPGDDKKQEFARELGVHWAGGSTTHPPQKLDAAIIFAPVGSLVVEALKSTAKGATIVCAGIHMSDIPSFPYRLLREERIIRSVANLTRKDGEQLMAIAPKIPISAQVERFPLERANEAISRLRNGQIHGAAVLTMD